MDIFDSLKFDSNGLITAVAQDAETGEVLMVAYMNRDTLAETLDTGTMVYWSRSRKKRWRKGETSGNIQTLADVYRDCDGDTLLFKVRQTGVACHEGYTSCFSRKRVDSSWKLIAEKSEK